MMNSDEIKKAEVVVKEVLELIGERYLFHRFDERIRMAAE